MNALTVVTGASSGIGYELAKVLADNGFDLVIAAENEEQGLREELRDTGVSVTTLTPGPTDTEFFDRAGMRDTKVGAGARDDPAQVAQQGLRGADEGRRPRGRGFAGEQGPGGRRQGGAGPGEGQDDAVDDGARFGEGFRRVRKIWPAYGEDRPLPGYLTGRCTLRDRWNSSPRTA